MTVTLSQPDAATGWFAGLELGFSSRDRETVLHKNRHIGPLRLQRPLYPEDTVCHACVLHPPGGVVGGDRLEIHVDVESDAKALVTTPGATKFYRSNGQPAMQESHLQISGGHLEWLPQESIFFPGANAVNTTSVHLENDGVFMGWEILCMGLPSCGQPFTQGGVTSTIEVNRGGRLIFRDRLRIMDGADLDRPAGLRGHSVAATFIASGCRPEMIPPMREAADAFQEMLVGITLIDDLMVARYIGNRSSEAKALFESLWTRIRPPLLGRRACAPRIWAT